MNRRLLVSVASAAFFFVAAPAFAQMAPPTIIDLNYGESVDIPLRRPGLPMTASISDQSSARRQYLDYVKLKPFCTTPQCLAASWRMVYTSVIDGVTSTKFSTTITLGSTPVIRTFDFRPAGSPLFYAADDADPNADEITLSFQCVANCPPLASQWPRVKGSEVRGNGGWLVLEDSSGLHRWPWHELWGHITPITPSVVLQTTLDDVPVPEGGTLATNAIKLSGKVNGDIDTRVSFNVELRKKSQPFTGEPTHHGSWANPGQRSEIVLPDLAPGTYHWRWCYASQWIRNPDFKMTCTEFRSVGDTDFTVPSGTYPQKTPTVAGLRQLTHTGPGATSPVYDVMEGELTHQGIRIFANVTSRNGNVMQAERKLASQPFDGTELFTSTSKLIGPMSVFVPLFAEVEDGVSDFRWRVRVRDATDITNISNWVEFGSPGNTDVRFSAE